MRLVSIDDLIDIYLKTTQRGIAFTMSKLNPNAKSRTKSAFNNIPYKVQIGGLFQ